MNLRIGVSLRSSIYIVFPLVTRIRSVDYCVYPQSSTSVRLWFTRGMMVPHTSYTMIPWIFVNKMLFNRHGHLPYSSLAKELRKSFRTKREEPCRRRHLGMVPCLKIKYSRRQGANRAEGGNRCSPARCCIWPVTRCSGSFHEFTRSSQRGWAVIIHNPAPVALRTNTQQDLF